MIFEPFSVQGAYLITRSMPLDQRGYFSRIVDVEEFQKRQINANFVQISVSQNNRKGTLRGLHSQTGDSAEDKLIVCTRGKVFDVCVDMRKDSSTYLKHCYAILSEENGRALYVPKGCAHGFITLSDNSQLMYFMTQKYNQEAERGYRWNDPVLSIKWPMQPEIISEKDEKWTLL